MIIGIVGMDSNGNYLIGNFLLGFFIIVVIVLNFSS